MTTIEKTPAVHLRPSAARLMGLALLSLLTGGCATGQKALLIQDDAQFQSVTAGTDKPVLVMFFKAGCPACAMLEPAIDQLATEYQGRAVVAKFMIQTFLGEVTSPALRERFGIGMVPHVVLLVHGQERRHWIEYQDIKEYRKGLDEVVAGTGPPPAQDGKPTP